jgi:cellulose synthase/poly-beta-1,6-N-acetylglucosamine synthase-like glycosyltransferase
MIFIFITVFFAVVYFIYLLLFYVRIQQSKKQESSYKKRTVSVVIAARNEEKNIGSLLTLLVNQTYPQELFDIIIADDGSTDSTKTIVQSFVKNFPNIRFVEVINREMALSPKKNALEQAIKCSNHELILCTDADCSPGIYWIESMVANFTDDIDMIAGFSKTSINWQKASLAQKFEHFDFLVLFFAAAGAISAGKMFSCSGQNFAYRKSAYEKVNGFASIQHLLSGDDVNLMQLFRRSGFKIGFSFTPYSFIVTQPTKSWSALCNQRIRWASNTKWQISLNPEFFFYLISVFGIVVLPFILFFIQWQLAVGIMLLRIILENLYLRKAGSFFKIEKHVFNFYLIWFFIQPVYILIVAILGQLGLFRWK